MSEPQGTEPVQPYDNEGAEEEQDTGSPDSGSPLVHYVRDSDSCQATDGQQVLP